MAGPGIEEQIERAEQALSCSTVRLKRSGTARETAQLTNLPDWLPCATASIT